MQQQQPPHMQQKTKGMQPGPGGPPNPYNCPPGMPMKGMGFGGNGPVPGGPPGGMGSPSPNHPGMGGPGGPGDFNHMGWNPVSNFLNASIDVSANFIVCF